MVSSCPPPSPLRQTFSPGYSFAPPQAEQLAKISLLDTTTTECVPFHDSEQLLGKSKEFNNQDIKVYGKRAFKSYSCHVTRKNASKMQAGAA